MSVTLKNIYNVLIKVEVKPKAKKPMNKNVNKPIKPKEKSEATKARDEAR